MHEAPYPGASIRLMDERPDLRAPGVPAYPSERQHAVDLAREYLRSGDLGDMACICRELLRALALSP